MRIIIAGAGEAGQQLAEKLCSQKHEIIIIDQESNVLEQGEGFPGVGVVHGSHDEGSEKKRGDDKQRDRPMKDAKCGMITAGQHELNS